MKIQIVDRDTAFGYYYCKQLTVPHMRLFRGAIDAGINFMDIYTKRHLTLAIEELLESKDNIRMY